MAEVTAYPGPKMNSRPRFVSSLYLRLYFLCGLGPSLHSLSLCGLYVDWVLKKSQSFTNYFFLEAQLSLLNVG